MWMLLVTIIAAQTDDCEPRCDGDLLLFCDGVGAAEIDCRDLAPGATCGLLSTEWGVDCLLPAGASCDVGYAGGAGRCAAPNQCGTQVEGEEPTCGARADIDSDVAPTPGTPLSTNNGTATNALGCPTTSMLWSAPLLAWLSRRRAAGRDLAQRT
jgi:hypothetical protein